MAARRLRRGAALMVLVGLLTSGSVAGVQAQKADHLAALREQMSRLYSQGKLAEALPLAERYVAVARKRHGENHLEFALALGWLANIHKGQGRYAEAEPLYRRSLAIREKKLGPDHLEVGGVLSNLAGLYRAQGRYIEADPLYQRGLAIAEKALGTDHSVVGTALHNLGGLYEAQGRYAEAEPLLRRGLATREKALGPDHPDVAQSLDTLAGLYDSQGRYAEAEPRYRRSLAIREKALGPDHPDVGLLLNNLATLYQRQGRYAEAEPLYWRALAVREKALGSHHSDVAQSLNNLATFYQVQGRYAEAEPLHQRSLAIREAALGTDHPDVAQSLNNLALQYQHQARYAEAEPLYRRSLAIREKALGPDHIEVGLSLNNLATLYYTQHDWTRAADFWRRSASVIVRRAQRGAHDIGQALTGRRQSEAEQLRSVFWGLVKAVHRFALEGRDAEPGLLREMFLTAQWPQGSEAARSLAQMAARQARGDSALARLVRERQDLVAEWQGRDKLLIAAVSQPPDKRKPAAEQEQRARLGAIDGRIQEIDKALAKDFPDYAALVSPAPLTVEGVQAQLGANEALVLFLDTPEWQPTPEESFIWVVTKAESRWVRSGLGTPSLQREVAALRCGLDAALWRGGEPQDRCTALVKAHPSQEDIDGQVADVPPFDLERAHALYGALLGPVEDLIRGKHLIIVPSGPLTSLRLHVLVTEPPKTRIPGRLAEYREAAWLGTRQPITVLPSVASLASLRRFAKASHAGKTYLGIGNPLLDGEQDHPRWGDHYRRQAEAARTKRQCPGTQTRHIAQAAAVPPSFATLFRGGHADIDALRSLMPLPETADELCEVGRRLGLPETEILLGGGATETALKDLSESGRLADYAILHFATHGALTGQVQGLAEPGLVLTPPAKGTSDAKALERDDGFLTASEIATLSLDADWVVLSACNTAGSSGETAEPLSGMARAFFYAGARALLVSHWEVGSDAAVKLTTRAFAELKSNSRIGRSEAFRISMRDLIVKGTAFEAHPSQWAPFVVVGEGAGAEP